jgi:DMSO/TMAO reductase YedYZ molybdopterin-dependent catalytic subunit
MDSRGISRRELLRTGSMTLAGLAFLRCGPGAAAFAAQPGEEVIPWLDQPAEVPLSARDMIDSQLRWEELDSWITPNDRFFTLAHFKVPAIDAPAWRLQIGGLVHRPLSLTLDELKARPRREVTFTVECSGNHGLPFFTGGIGNATWAGTPLALLLDEVGVVERGTEVVFFGTDMGEHEVRQVKLPESFARSMSLADAAGPDTLLCYEMNGAPLPASHGAPLRLIAPGWYGVANVKWLDRIEVLDTRYMGHFMARDYVTIRLEQQGGQTVRRETSVGRALLKSAPAKVARTDGDGDREYRIFGAAWGGPIAGVEVRVDDGTWMPATITEGAGADFAWKFWAVEWGSPAPGEHAITSRAIDTAGNVQPAMDDPRIATKQTIGESNGQITRRILIT